VTITGNEDRAGSCMGVIKKKGLKVEINVLRAGKEDLHNEVRWWLR